MAALRGQPDAQVLMGAFYENGAPNILKDLIMAHMWYNIASSNGVIKAKQKRDNLEAGMPPADVSEAMRKANVCLKSKYKSCD
ncbi:hypothetical protein OAI47_01785 [Rhodospirillaceae bacterium]|nr:hypothetical protein [Rhodospirillaceae bacterium]